MVLKTNAGDRDTGGLFARSGRREILHDQIQDQVEPILCNELAAEYPERCADP